MNSLSSWIVNKNLGANVMSSDCGPYPILGGFLNFGVGASVQKTFKDLLPHYAVGTFFDFYKIDLWDNENLLINVDSSTKLKSFN